MNCASRDAATQVIFPPCHIRATASGISRRLAEFGLDPSGYRVGQRVLTLVVGVQLDQRGAVGGVTHADQTRLVPLDVIVSASGRVRSVCFKPNWLTGANTSGQARCLDRGEPHPTGTFRVLPSSP